MDPVDAGAAMIQKLPEYGLLGIMLALEVLAILGVWKQMLKVMDKHEAALTARIQDNIAVQSLINSNAAAFKALEMSVTKRTEMTERVAAGQTAQVAAIEHVADSMQQFARQLQLSDNAARLRADDIVNRIESIETKLRVSR